VEAQPLRSSNVKQSILSFIRDESGAAAAEYALILAIVGAAIATAAGNLGTAVSDAIQAAADAVTGANV
jgi:pilus assembly protein Flp/PilA